MNIFVPKYYTSFKSIINIDKNKPIVSNNVENLTIEKRSGNLLINKIIIRNIYGRFSENSSILLGKKVSLDEYLQNNNNTFYIRSNFPGYSGRCNSPSYIKLEYISYIISQNTYNIKVKNINNLEFNINASLEVFLASIQISRPSNTLKYDIGSYVKKGNSTYCVIDIQYSYRGSIGYTDGYDCINISNFGFVYNISEDAFEQLNQDELKSKSYIKFSEIFNYLITNNNYLYSSLKKNIYIINKNIIDAVTHKIKFYCNNLHDIFSVYINNNLIIPSIDDINNIDNIIKEAKERFAKRFIVIENIAKEVYEDNYYFNKENLYLVVFFPEITIRNSKNNTHIIRELYIIIKFREDGTIESIKGTRGLVSDDERRADYIHSHLNRYEGDFCLGSSLVAELKAELSDEFNEDNFETLLYHLESLASWESVEGTPYRHMTSITRSSTSSNLYRIIAETTIRNLSNNILKYIKNTDSIDNFLNKTIRFGIPYYEISIEKINPDTLYELGFKKVFIDNNVEIIYDSYIKDHKTNDDGSIIKKTSIHKSQNYKYKDVFINTFSYSNNQPVNLDNINIIPSKQEIEKVEYYINNLIYGI